MTFRALLLVMIYMVISMLMIQVTNGKKLNFEECRGDDECESPRTCLTRTHAGEIIPCNPKYSLCMCGALPVNPCSTSRQCSEGEHCARAYFMPYAACTSCKSELRVTSLDDSCPPPSSPSTRSLAVAAEDVITTSGGLSGDFCKVDGKYLPDGCQGLRTCGNMYHGIYTSCNAYEKSCYCLELPTPPCSSSNECQVGERCVYHTLAHSTMCVSCSTPFMATKLFEPIDYTTNC